MSPTSPETPKNSKPEESLQDGRQTVAYVRVSSEDQRQKGLSISAQIELAHAQEPINRIYKDEAKTGTLDIDEISIRITENGMQTDIKIKRKEFLQLLQDCQNKKIKKIYISTWDRLSRNLIVTETLMMFFTKNNIEIQPILESKEPLIRQILITISQEEIKKIQLRNDTIMQYNFQLGIPIGRPPIGYTKERNQEGKTTGKIIINEIEAQKIRSIFMDTIQEKNYKEICRKYNINPSQYYNIIRNKTYMGIITYKKQERKGNYPPIISQEEWQKANEKISRR